MGELDRITHDPKVIRILEARSITSLEQIALSSPALLGLPESKARQIIQSAMNVLAEENIESISLGKMDIRMGLKKTSKAIFDSVMSTIGAEPDENCSVRRIANSIVFSMKAGKRHAFKTIIKNTEKLRVYLDEKKKQVMINEGITLPKEQIIKFAKEKGFDGFSEEFFSDIVGNDLMKKTITVSLFSTFDDPVHTLVLGDPGSAKTLARDLLITNLGNITPIGANATKSGLVCNLATGELGALAVSDKKVVIVDEFDKINPNDLEFCYELMSNGRCSVHSARVHRDIVSHFILIAFGNPKSEVFNNAMPLEDIGMERTLLSRFAFIVKTESLTTEEKKRLFKGRFLGESKLSEHSQLFDQWIKLAKTQNPRMRASDSRIDNFVKEAVRIVDLHATTPLRRDLRMGDYLRRIAMAFARAEFVDVTDAIIDKAFQLVKNSIDVWNFKEGKLDFF
jgi:DNA replicative helicase MCM subunit Mcm2 (Cdc46/Mcm family)